MRQTVEAYNAFLHNVYIDISSLEEAYILRERQDGKTQRVSINQSKKFVRRILVEVSGISTEGSMVGFGRVLVKSTVKT